jgi:hypothetical protein
MDNGYTRWGCQDTWGAQTHPMGYRGDQIRQAARVAIANVGDLLTPASWTFDATPNSRLQAYARARS